MTTKSLLVVAHGSRRTQSNDEVQELVARLRALEHPYSQIECAFLEIAEPAIPDGLRGLIKAGATEVVLMPYFLSAGRHVVTDIPREAEIVREEYPEVNIRIAPYIGAASGIADMLLSQAESIPPR